MGLIVLPGENELKLSTLTFDSIYARVSWNADKCGKRIDFNLSTYLCKEDYLNDEVPIYINIPISGELILEQDEVQSSSLVLEKVRDILNDEGYDCEIEKEN